ncbi:MAG TPA: GGDEF domain-containing protein [Actinophytocola sp.]|uniref:GGDEF domain-containing protein n=1 Tax=Actinophytocola sp. TaxID=1872138 RepID=UPI002DB65723|nr:GGDEF domain-containing protein [Actinophytocola sp.]HEU5476007.1 GGDEF domain-containing protein [Actinophytocola sp.]
MAVPDQRVTEPPGHTANLIAFHESIAGMLAEQGMWRQAYAHARQALDIVSANRTDAPAPPRIPEQLRAEFDRLRREHAEAHEQAIRDALTASYNRRYLDQRLLAPVGNPLPGGADGLAVALVDLDRFKRVNDTFGHQVGDRVLQRVVELLQEGLPDTGFCARYGGEEFVLVLPGVTAPAAVRLVEAARARVEGYPWRTIAGGLRVTVSIGLDHAPPAGSGADRPQTQLRRADALLYAAKRSGRNAVAYRVDGQIRLAGAAARRRSADRSDRLPHRAVLIPQVD